MSLPTACCTLPPVESNYSPQGIEVRFGDFVIYEAGGTNKSEKLLICFYDIFGFHPVTKQVCDMLASSGTYKVAMPDFFRGNPYPSENYPPKDHEEIMEFLRTTGSWEKALKDDLPRLVQHYKSQGFKHIGAFGFCWGGKMSVEAVVNFPQDIKAAVLIHPSLISTEDGDRVKAPVLTIPAKDDPDMVPFNEKVKAKFGDEGSGHHRFDDVHHGFCSARGNLEDELNRKKVDEALSLTFNFFKKHLK